MSKIRQEIIKTIEQFFDELSQKSFTFAELGTIFTAKGDAWNLPAGWNAAKFVNLLETKSHLHRVELECENYPNIVRIVWKEPLAYIVAESIKKKSFFSHGSAADLHGLTEVRLETIYVNYEQSAKSTINGGLIQANVDRAFAGNQRQSKLIYKYLDKEIVVINGKFTDRLGVEPLTDNFGNEFMVTNLERTLIDITVRPSYAAGPFEVLKVYERLKDKISVTSLISMLKQINYTYPYHQAIGFYMQKAGFAKNDSLKLQKLGLNIDFYLAHGLGETKKYDSTWRIFYPKGM